MKSFQKMLPALRSWGAFLLIGLVLVGASYLLLYKLGSEPFQDYDEATYAEVVTEGLAAHDYVSFTFLHLDYFNKPPLLFWLMDVSHTLVPSDELGMRLPSALSGIALVAVVMIAVYFVTENQYAAAVGGGVLATTAAFIEPARQVRFDILVSLFITLSVFAFLRAMEDRRWFLWYGVFIGLAVLTKGPLVVYALVPSFIIMLVYPRLSWLHDWQTWAGAGISLVIIAPWHIYETVKYGSTFWNVYLYGQIVQRVANDLFTIQPTNAEYFQYLIQFASPWIYIFCLSICVLPFIWKHTSLRSRALLLASYAGVAIVLIISLITKTKAFSYLIPLYPFAGIVIGITLFEVGKNRSIFARYILSFACIILLIYGAYESFYTGFHIDPYFTAEVSLARQEKDIATILKVHGANVFYTYDTTTVGSIMYYSGIVTPIEIDAGTVVPSGTYVLYQTSEESKLKNAYPQEKLAPVYQGASLSLGVLGG